jgi:hypothetical protein
MEIFLRFTSSIINQSINISFHLVEPERGSNPQGHCALFSVSESALRKSIYLQNLPKGISTKFIRAMFPMAESCQVFDMLGKRYSCL